MRNKIGYIKGIKCQITPETEERKLRERIVVDTENINRYELEIERYKWAIERAKKRIKRAKKVLKVKFADIEQL